MKPSKILRLTAKKAIFLLPGFRALTWKGVVYCKYKSDIGLINHEYTDKITSNLESHETIHVRQAQSTSDSWLKFYTLYMLYWFGNFPLFIYGTMMPYYFIPFELEAYNNERNYDYPSHGAVYQWKEFKKLTLKQKLKLAKDYKKSINVDFKAYVRNVIASLINKD